MEDAVVNNKRSRDDVEESSESPEAKRIREDLFDIFDDESEPDNRDPAIHDLDSVMRSFEEEIALPPPPESVPSEDPNRLSYLDPQQPDLGFLLEASDDELGLPPAEVAGGEGEDAAENGQVEASRFGNIWGLDDEIHLDFGFGSEERGEGGDDGVIFDGGLFDNGDGNCVLSDFSDLTWRPEFLPAV